ncbi:MAG: 30S ribosomal protein S2 [Planctomycetota bacterium]|jgi:small subunit ribosomal protein S2
MPEPIVKLSELIESGVHFGHRQSRWNPKMERYIFGKRNLIHIIDLRQTVRGLIRAVNFLEKLSQQGGEVIFVGTKRQAQALVKKNAQACDMHWVCERWLGGTLTNFPTIMSRLKRLDELEGMIGDTTMHYSKKYLSALRREHKKIHRNLEGVRGMARRPDALIVIDPGHEHICMREAKKLNIPVVALVDTDTDPSTADIVVPGNDDAYRSIEVLLSRMANCMKDGRKKYKVQLEKQRDQEKKRRLEEQKRQEEIRASRETAAAQRRKINEDNAAKIAEARAKHLAQKDKPGEETENPAAETAEAAKKS